MPVTEADCRREGLDEATIERLRRNGWLEEVSAAGLARWEVRDEIEAIDADMPGLLEELADVKARIAAAKARRAELVVRYKGLRK